MGAVSSLEDIVERMNDSTRSLCLVRIPYRGFSAAKRRTFKYRLGYIRCSYCNSLVKTQNLGRHVRKVHSPPIEQSRPTGGTGPHPGQIASNIPTIQI